MSYIAFLLHEFPCHFCQLEIKITTVSILQICFHETRTRDNFNTGICGGPGEGQDMTAGSIERVRPGIQSQGCLISVGPRLNH